MKVLNGIMLRRARFTVGVLCAAATLRTAPVWAQPATSEEVQNPLLVLQHLPEAPSHARIQVKTYDFKELGAPSEYQLFVPTCTAGTAPAATASRKRRRAPDATASRLQLRTHRISAS
jgi:hypothetical protein